MPNARPLGWLSILRLGLVQSALGAIVMLTTSLLNRVMVVEYALAAAIPAGLVAWHYGVQLSRPKWGHGSDSGRRRTPFIIGGIGMLALGAILATNATLMAAALPGLALVLAILGYTMIGVGVAASGTSLLALLATSVAPERRAAAAATTWIMMIAGIVVTAGIAGQLLDPFSPQRLAFVAGGVATVAFLVAAAAVAGVEQAAPPVAARPGPVVPFREALEDVWHDPKARRFSLFVLVAMLAYSMQDMILEPFAGLVFEFTPGQSTSLSGIQHAGVLLGMVIVGVSGRAFGKSEAVMRAWVVAGCLASAAGLAVMAMAGSIGPGFPLKPAVFFLGLANGVFAVSAIGAMMGLAGAGGSGREGIRVGLWGAAQAIAFGAGGFLGAVGVDIGRALLPTNAQAFLLVFLAEAALFVMAALIALTISNGARIGVTTRHPKEILT